MAPEVKNWQEWLGAYAEESGYPFVARALSALVANEKIAAVWITGSRATRQADAHSDTDIRIHAPAWSASDLETWLKAVDPERPAFVRLSRFGPSVLNYECLFRDSIPIDLLAMTGEPPVLAFDAVVFKWREPLSRQPSLQVVKEAPIATEEVRNLMDGAVIDQQKFRKLFARDDRIGALFLLEAQRFALLRLAYLAARGVDCGAKPQHTLASLRLVQETIMKAGTPAVQAIAADLAATGTLTETVKLFAANMPPLFAELRRRFADLPPAR